MAFIFMTATATSLNYALKRYRLSIEQKFIDIKRLLEPDVPLQKKTFALLLVGIVIASINSFPKITGNLRIRCNDKNRQREFLEEVINNEKIFRASRKVQS